MNKRSRTGLFLGLLVLFSPVTAEVNPESIIQIFQRLEILEKKTRELHGENEVLKHQINQLKKGQKQGFLNVDKRIERLSEAQNSDKKAEDSKSQTTSDKKDENIKEVVKDKPAEITSNSKAEEPKKVAETKSQQQTEKPEKEKVKKDDTTTADNPAKKKSREPTAYERETYQAAFNSMNASPSAATRSFREYIKMQPDSPLAANAQYWIGEVMYSHNNYKGAIEEFIIVLQKYKYSSKAPDAAIKLGYSFYAIKNWSYARRTFEDVLKYFPENKNAVNLAKKRLEKMTAAGH